MASIKLKKFFGQINTTDTKDLNQDACLRMKNLVCEPHQFSTRCGAIKLGTAYPAGINLIYTLNMAPSGTKTIIMSGTKLYTHE